jgi:hypothetical protein
MSLRIREFAARIKLRRDRDLESLEEKQGSKSPHGNKLRRKDAKLFGEETLRAWIDGRNSWREKRRYPWAVGSNKYTRRIKAKSLSTLEVSREIASCRSKGI